MGLYVDGLRSLANQMSKFGDHNCHGVAEAADEMEEMQEALECLVGPHWREQWRDELNPNLKETSE